MKIVTVIGARPQFIKAATVSRVVSGVNEIDEVLLHTGQHFDENMSHIFFNELDIPVPKYNLGIAGGGHGKQTGLMLEKIEEVLISEKPDMVLVYGDTNSTLAGSLAAVKLHIPIAHVEAGLRSFNKKMPEEINRVMTDHSADLLFAPTETAIRNLEKEGISKTKIINVGDVMYDASLYYLQKAEGKTSILTNLGLREKEYILATIHRAENTNDDQILSGIFNSLEEIANNHKMVFPIHPRTKMALDKMNYSFDKSSIKFIEPLGYLDMVMLERNAKLIITDSGGVQKEAYFHKVPCITLREETEWVELVEKGFNFLANAANIKEVLRLAFQTEISADDGVYGNGFAANKIIEELLIFKNSKSI